MLDLCSVHANHTLGAVSAILVDTKVGMEDDENAQNRELEDGQLDVTRPAVADGGSETSVATGGLETPDATGGLETSKGPVCDGLATPPGPECAATLPEFPTVDSHAVV